MSAQQTSCQLDDKFETCGFDVEIQLEQRQKRAGVYVKSIVGSRDSGLDSAKLSTSPPSCEPNNLEAYGFDAEIQCDESRLADSAGQDSERGTLHLNHLSSTPRKASRKSRSSLASIPTGVVASLETPPKETDQTIEQPTRHKRAAVYVNSAVSSLRSGVGAMSAQQTSCQLDDKFETCGFDVEIQLEQRQKRAGVYVKSIVGSRDSGLDSAKLSTSPPSCEPNNLEAYGFDAEIQCDESRLADSAGQDSERGTLHLNHLSSTARKASRSSVPLEDFIQLLRQQRAKLQEGASLLKTFGIASIPTGVVASLETSSENQRAEIVQHFRKDLLKKPMDNDTLSIADPGCASDVTCESAYPAENRLSNKEFKARRALRFPRKWLIYDPLHDLAAMHDPVEEHGFVPIATPNHPSIGSVYCEPVKLTQPIEAASPNLAADRTGAGGHGYLNELNSFRHGFCQPEKLDSFWEALGHPDDSHDSDYRRRATDSDYTCEDFQKGLSQQPMPTPPFMNYVERNLDRLCKNSTASGVELTVITSDAPRIRYAAGHMWFDKEAADDKPNESTEKQAQSEDKSSTAKHILARFCGCFRVKQEEDTYGEEIAPSA